MTVDASVSVLADCKATQAWWSFVRASGGGVTIREKVQNKHRSEKENFLGFYSYENDQKEE